MRILYISQYYPPEMGAPAARVSELARHWVRAGHQVTVLTGFPNHPTGRLHSDYRRKFFRLVYRERVDGIDVVRTWLVPLPNRRSYERIINYASFCLSSCLTGLFLKRSDLLIATSPQLLVGVSGWWLSRMKRMPFVLEIRDLWPESLDAVGFGGRESLLILVLRALAGFLYRACAHVVVVTPAFKEELVEKWRIEDDKISLVENGVETDLFAPNGSSRSFKSTLGLENRFIVSYIGTLGLAHGLDTMLEAAYRMQPTHPEIIFLLIGEGADKERLEILAQEANLTNVRFLPQQPRNRLPEFVRASDLCLVLLKKSEVFKTVIPTKMLEFMACGRPVLLGVDGQARRVLEDAKAGLCVPPENARALADAIIRLSQDERFREALGNNGRDYIVNNFSREKTARTYLKVLEGLKGNG